MDFHGHIGLHLKQKLVIAEEVANFFLFFPRYLEKTNLWVVWNFDFGCVDVLGVLHINLLSGKHLAVAYCIIQTSFQNHNLERWINSHRLLAQLGRTIVRVSQYIFSSFNWYFIFLAGSNCSTFKMGYVGSILARSQVVKVGKAELGCKLEGILDFF